MDEVGVQITGRAARLLVIEDDADLRMLVAMHLGRAGWEIESATSEAEGLTAAEAFDPDVVLLDLGLAQGDGRDLLRTLKADSRTSWIPVVVASGRVHPDEVTDVLRLGAQDYVKKPWDLGELEARLAAALRVANEHRALATAEEQYRTAFESAPVGMAQLSLGGEFLEVNHGGIL